MHGHQHCNVGQYPALCQQVSGCTSVHPYDYVVQKASEAKFHAVKNMQTGVVYPSIKAACEDSGLDRSTIIRHCNGTLKKQKWKYAEEGKK